MAIYIFELIFVFVMGMLLYMKKINNRTFIIVVFFVLAMVLGLRGEEVGEDTAHFIDIFNYAQNLTWKTTFTSGLDVIYTTVYSADLSIEVGYLILNKLVGIFTDNAQWLIFIVAAATCWLFGKFIYDNFQKVFLPTYVFLCESLYMNSFNLMRQILAIAIALQAFKLIKEGKYKKAVIVILVGFLFHKTAILLLALIPLYLWKNKKRATKLVFIGAVVFIVGLQAVATLVSILVPRYASYFTTNYWNTEISGIVVLWLIEIVLCLLFYFYRGLKRDDNEVFIPVASTIIYIACEIVSFRVSMFSRIAMVFSPFLMQLFVQGKTLFGRKTRTVYLIGLIAVLTVMFLLYAKADSRVYYFFWQE